MEKKTWICIGVGAIAILTTILYILYLIFKMIAALITSFGAFAVFVACIFLIIRYVIRILVFPGSCIFIRKMIEMNIRKSMAKVIINTFYNLIYAVDTASHRLPTSVEDADIIAEAVIEVQKLIQSFKTNHGLQVRLKTITADQEAFQSKLEDVQKAIASIRLIKYKPTMINIELSKATKPQDTLLISDWNNIKILRF